MRPEPEDSGRFSRPFRLVSSLKHVRPWWYHNHMKTVLVIVGLIILGAIGYYYLMPAPASESGTPDTMSQGKIDINAVCEGALAYMSFPSGAEAEAWVEACKRGEHPEAIEQWKQMNGITDDRAI